MTLDEKVTMLGLAASPDGYQNHFPSIPEHGIPRLTLQDGPSGVAGGFRGVTQLPAPITVAANWSRSVAKRYGETQGKESWAKGIQVAQGPNVNIARVSQNGRTFEGYGEDPYLTSQLAVANIKGIQSQGVMANVKHYVANNQETERQHINEIIDERALREIYMPAFEAAVTIANVASFMGAYNQVNGEYSCQNQHLLNEVLKDEWGFQGFVRSDLGAVHSATKAYSASLDQAKPERGAELKAVVENAEIAESTLDEAVRRILEKMSEYDLFERQPTGTPDTPATTPAHAEFARQTAEQGTVLLKNDSMLPLNIDELKSIAIIGSGAGEYACTGGGGSSSVIPPYVVTPLNGITKRLGDKVEVRYAQGDEPYGSLPVLPSQFLTPPSGEGDGLQSEYYSNGDLSGSPELTCIDPTINSLENHSLDERLGNQWSSRWTGTLSPPKTGTYAFSLTSNGASQLYIDGELVANNELIDLVINNESLGNLGMRTITRSIELTADQPVEIEVHYSRGRKLEGLMRLGWQPPEYTMPSIEEAAEAARDSDAAVVFVGYVESEGYDLETLELPGIQNQLIDAVTEANSNTCIVINTGGAVLMPWADKARGIVEAWYPGQENGSAIARVLVGDVNPSGKLPITFPLSDTQTPTSNPAQWPGVNGISNYTEELKVGYRWYDTEDVEPLFAFGHGLSYTSFAYRNLEFAPEVLEGQAAKEVRVEVTNIGQRPGSEVAQLYVGMPTSSGEPQKQLKGFEKVLLEPGQTKSISFKLDSRALSYWDVSINDWVVPEGLARVMIGSSSRDIRLEDSFLLHWDDVVR